MIVTEIHNKSEVLYQNQECYEAIIVEGDEDRAECLLIQQSGEYISLHISCIDEFVKSLRRVSANAKKIVEENKLKKASEEKTQKLLKEKTK